VPETIVLLHGFAGTRRAWEPVIAGLEPERYRPLALDLRGHGSARDRRPVTVEACVADVLEAAPTRFELCGYSLGARVALHVALAAPSRVTRMVLISGTAGIEDEKERAERRSADEALATEMEAMTIASFADRWAALPLFAEEPAPVAAAAREDRLRNDPVALAAALRGLGAGVMAPVWSRLGELAMPVILVVGEGDKRYRTVAERMAARLPAARLVVVPGAGHGVAREAPAAVVAALIAEEGGRGRPPPIP
jgi:2-succinyl-6-hydroxy-2,4-cyclohexadiene-1-carboxylate synthase